MKDRTGEGLALFMTLLGLTLWMFFAWNTTEKTFWCGILAMGAIGWCVVWLLKTMGED